MRSLVLALLLLACSPFSCRDPAPPPRAAAEAPVPPAAARPGGLALVERLSLPRAVWGTDAGNAVKSMAVAYDPDRDLLYTAGSGSGVVSVTSPSDGHPSASVDLDDAHVRAKDLLVDPARGRLAWLDRATGAVRVLDTATRQVVARRDPRARGPRGKGRMASLALDPATGWFWLLDPWAPALSALSPDLDQERPIAGFTDPSEMAADPRGDLLYVLDNLDEGTRAELYSYRPSSGERTLLRTFERPERRTAERRTAERRAAERRAGPPGDGPAGRDRAGRRPRPPDALLPPRLLHVTPDGTLLLVGRRITALGPGGEEAWTADVPGEVNRAVSVGSRVALVLRDAGFGRGHPESLVAVLDAATGRDLGVVKVGYEAQKAAADPKRNRLFVSNGGAGSVSVIDMATLEVTGTIHVALAAEGLVLDPRTGVRYVLDRLGGSSLHVWKPGSDAVATWPVGGWPTELALDPGRRRLYALGHFASALYAWDLDRGERLPPLPLGAPGNTGDTLGDLDLDAPAGVAAAVFPESGSLAVVRPADQEVLWTRQIPGMAAGPGAGPGLAQVGVDAGRDRVWVVDHQAGRILAFSLATGAPAGDAALPPRGARGRSYSLDTLHVDTAGGRLFAGGTVLDAATLAVTGAVPGVDKVVWVDDRDLVGLAIDPDGAEFLVLADPTTFATRSRWPLEPRLAMGREAWYDPAARVVYLCSLPTAEVTAFRVP